jgi:hypothetical protein
MSDMRLTLTTLVIAFATVTLAQQPPAAPPQRGGPGAPG